LSRVFAVKESPVVRNRRFRGATSVLHVDPGWGGECADVFEFLATQRECLVPVWWIQKYDFERRSLPIYDEFKGIRPYDLCSTRAESVEIRLQLLYHPHILVDKNDGFGAARQGLETERAAAGVQIQATCVRDDSLKPVEERFADSVRRGADAGKGCKRQFSATPLSSDNA